MVNTNYHKSINKTLILENYFCALQKGLLLRNNHLEHHGFAIGTLMSFWKRYNERMEHLACYQHSYPQYSFGYAKSCIAIGTKMRAYGL
jgi:hypothetical protein